MQGYLGIDNGVTGSLALITDDDITFMPTPVKVEQSYTRAKANITRVDIHILLAVLDAWTSNLNKDNIRIFFERPMVNPGRFKATVSALRSLEASLIAVEYLKLPHVYIDSKQWQRDMLPKGCTGPDLKTASVDIGCRIFPRYSKEIKNMVMLIHFSLPSGLG
jgi:hypothetical protein